MSWLQEEYQDAIRCYTQAISLCPSLGAYYGNRAAAWVMLKEYRRGVQDCAEGVTHEKTVGQFDKLRQRQANALAGMGQRDKAIAFLEEVLLLEREETAHVPQLEAQLAKLRAADSCIVTANDSLKKKEFSRAKRLFQNAQAEGMTDDPTVLLGIAQACLGLGDYEDAARFSQKAISAGGSSVSTETYLVRADALQATGCTDLAMKHLTVALQMDPDNSLVGIVSKHFKHSRVLCAALCGSVLRTQCLYCCNIYCSYTCIYILYAMCSCPALLTYTPAVLLHILLPILYTMPVCVCVSPSLPPSLSLSLFLVLLAPPPAPYRYKGS